MQYVSANRCISNCLGRMSINFMVSRSRDIAFHMNPRVREGMVVRNSMIGGNWGQEERELSLNPFMEGQYFDVSPYNEKKKGNSCVILPCFTLP